jgi:hypothetical protein
MTSPALLQLAPLILQLGFSVQNFDLYNENEFFKNPNALRDNQNNLKQVSGSFLWLKAFSCLLSSFSREGPFKAHFIII